MKLLIVVIEAILVSFLLFRLYKLTKKYKSLGKEGAFLPKIEMILNQTFPKAVAAVVLREITMLYFLVAKKSESIKGEAFSYHKEIGYKGILIALLSVILLESAGLFFLLHNWNLIVSYVHIFLNLYAVMYLISDYRAIVQRPFLVTNTEIVLQLGSRREVTVPFYLIESIRDGKRFHDEKKNKDIFKAVLIEFDTPNFEISMKEPIETKTLLGNPTLINKVYVTVDEKDKFRQLMKERIE